MNTTNLKENVLRRLWSEPTENQGKLFLKSGNNRFCALGIVVDELVKLNPERFSWQSNYDGRYYFCLDELNGQRSYTILSPVLLRILKFDFDLERRISYYNDNGVSWAYIADRLEDDWEF